MTDEECFERWVKGNPFVAEQTGAAAALALIRRLRAELLAAYNRIEAQKEILEQRAQKRG